MAPLWPSGAPPQSFDGAPPDAQRRIRKRASGRRTAMSCRVALTNRELLARIVAFAQHTHLGLLAVRRFQNSKARQLSAVARGSQQCLNLDAHRQKEGVSKARHSFSRGVWHLCFTWLCVPSQPPGNRTTSGTRSSSRSVLPSPRQIEKT
jgi:hypothetical protein